MQEHCTRVVGVVYTLYHCLHAPAIAPYQMQEHCTRVVGVVYTLYHCLHAHAITPYQIHMAWHALARTLYREILPLTMCTCHVYTLYQLVFIC
jgi:hypothetical protein